MSENDLFDKFGLTVEAAEVEVGKMYPLYGYITQILNPDPQTFTIEINGGIILRCWIQDEESAEKLKERAFEPAIFVTTVTGLDPVKGDCTTIVFGKKQDTTVT